MVAGIINGKVRVFLSPMCIKTPSCLNPKCPIPFKWEQREKQYLTCIHMYASSHVLSLHLCAHALPHSHTLSRKKMS